ncbi:MAG: hypothetical protein EKE20_14570 [Candidatus Symbiopectobacterium sp. Dall1.0]|nr:hypothetical protein [Candidatus Symbiopectobacterium sp. Dall1.0]
MFNIAKSLVPSIASQLYKLKNGNNIDIGADIDVESFMEPKACAIASVAIFRMMDYLDKDDVPTIDKMTDYAMKSIEKANSLNNEKHVVQYHYQDEPIKIVGIAIRLGYLTHDKSTHTVSVSDKWIAMMAHHKAALPLSEPITEENRRKPYVKGGRTKPSNLAKSCIEYLEATEYHVEAKMIEIVNEYINRCTLSQTEVNGIFKDENHVLMGAMQVLEEEKLYSEYFADTRGRLYHVACAGPNPQSSDFARSLYSINVENWVEKGCKAYDMFMAELEDISSEKWLTEKMLTEVALRPVDALNHMMQKDNQHGDIPKKPFTYIRLALDWYKFETEGKCDSRVGFGLDAKCSGTQYLAFISGNMDMAKATGLVSDDSNSLDPYQLSLIELVKLIKESRFDINVDKYLNPKDGRTFIKTPYMAIQYGGGVKALYESSEFMADLAKMGITAENKKKVFINLTIQAIKSALGERICKFIDKVQEAVAMKLSKENKPHLAYRHTDDFKVMHLCYPNLTICEPFSIRVADKMPAYFGSVLKNEPWKIKSSTATPEEFVRTFVVNFIQGIDALVARTVAKHAKRAELRGFTSIHDCFRCCLADAPKMMDVIRDAYHEVFVENDQFENLSKQIDGIGMHNKKIVTKELVYSKSAYYFCQ